MNLYETDKDVLKSFITNEKIDGVFTEKYLILQNFADDCRFSSDIQPELMEYLLPFYLRIIEEAIMHQNKMAEDIYSQFNSMIFFNQQNFKNSVGEKYPYVMEYYVEQTVKRMEMGNKTILGDISLFNTTIAFDRNNIVKLFDKIYGGSLAIKYSFFKYISVLLFKESDNLLAINEERPFWTSEIWDFDAQFSDAFFWNQEIVQYYERHVTRQEIEEVFKDITPILYNSLGKELMNLFSSEMEKSFATGTFEKRKKEYLQKINCRSEKYKYWTECFQETQKGKIKRVNFLILTRTYERDYSGLVTKINRPGGRYTRYCYDKLGRVIRADYYDKTYENFTYNKNGALIEAENQYGKVKFERDSLGRITKEWQGRQFFYDEEGKKVWKRNLDIYGRVKTEEVLGKKNFIPFRFQGQYEDEETELYYNRFRYYDSQQGQYTQQDPIRLAGGNPTIYGYVKDVNIWVDVFGLDSFFRSMSREEFFDIQDFGWRASASGMSGKWFADSYEDAIVFGQKMGNGVDTKFYVIEVDIPDYIVDNEFRNPGKHDGIGAASYFEVEDLNQKSVKIKSRNSVRADWKQQVLGGCNG